MEIFELHAIVYGLVQGVFFRSTTHKLAKELGITGTVRNLDDGSVEIIAQGERENLENFIQHLQQNGPGKIDKIIQDFSKPKKVLKDFSVLR